MALIVCTRDEIRAAVTRGSTASSTTASVEIMIYKMYRIVTKAVIEFTSALPAAYGGKDSFSCWMFGYSNIFNIPDRMRILDEDFFRAQKGFERRASPIVGMKKIAICISTWAHSRM